MSSDALLATLLAQSEARGVDLVTLRALVEESSQAGARRALASLEDVPATDGWQLVTMQLIRRRVVRDVAGPWAAAIDFRARMLATT